MAEKVNIASLSIDVDEVIKESVRLQKEMDSLKTTQKELDRTTEEGSAAYQKNEAQLRNLRKAYRDNQNFAAALDDVNKDLNQTMSVQGKSTQELYDSRRQLNQVAKQIKGDSEEEIELRNKINEAIDEQTDQIKKQAPGYIQLKENIGNYEGAIRKLSPQMASILDQVKTVAQALYVKRDATIASTQASGGLSKALGVMKIALLSTGIGALIIAFGALVTWLKTTQQGIDTVTKVTKPLEVIFKSLLGVVQNLGGAMVKAFQDPEKAVKKLWDVIKTNLVNRVEGLGDMFKALGKIISSGFTEGYRDFADATLKTTTGVEDVIEKTKQAAQATGQFFSDSIDKGLQLRQIAIDIEKAEADLVLNRDVLTDQMKEQELIAKDTSLSTEERNKAVEKAIDLSRQLATEEKNIINLKIQQEEIEQSMNDSGREDLKNLNSLKAELYRKDAEQRQTELRFLGTSKTLRNEAAASAKKAVEDAIKLQERELSLFIANQGVKARSLEESLNIEQEVAKKKIEIIDKQLKSNLISQVEYDTEYLNIKNSLLQKQAELTADNARRELEQYINTNRSKIDYDRFLTDESIKVEQDRLEGIAQAQREYEAKRLEAGVISQQEYNDAINAINEENRIENEELEFEREEALKEKAAIDAENRLALLELEAENEFQVLAAHLEAEKEAEIKAAERTGADTTLIYKKYAERQKQIEQDLNDAKLAISSATFGGLAAMLGEHTAAGKAAGIAQATINTYQGISEVWKAPSVLPEPFNTASKLAATATTLASGLSAVSKITSTSTKFSKGDILKGRSHAQGGIPFLLNGQAGFEAEGGEALINKRSTAMFAPLLSAINVAGGGKSFAYGGITGATSTAPSTSLLDYDLLAAKVAEANMMLPSPSVSVEEIKSVSNNIEVVERIATF